MDRPAMPRQTQASARDIQDRDYDFCSDTESDYDVLEDVTGGVRRLTIVAHADAKPMSSQQNGANTCQTNGEVLNNTVTGSSVFHGQQLPQITTSSKIANTNQPKGPGFKKLGPSAYPMRRNKRSEITASSKTFFNTDQNNGDALKSTGTGPSAVRHYQLPQATMSSKTFTANQNSGSALKSTGTGQFAVHDHQPPQITTSSTLTTSHHASLSHLMPRSEPAEAKNISSSACVVPPEGAEILASRPTYDQLTSQVQYFRNGAGMVEVAPSLSPLGCDHSFQIQLRLKNTEFVCDGCARTLVGDMHKCCNVLSLSGQIMECQDWLCKNCAQYFKHNLASQLITPRNEEESLKVIGRRNRMA